MGRSIWIGFDPREADAFAVAFKSIARRLTHDIEIKGVVLDHVRKDGLYFRPTETRINDTGNKQLWDTVSGWWMSTEFAISRFLTPVLAKGGMALFVDCDVMARTDLVELFKLAEADKSKAVWCVQHEHMADGVKMDGQIQSPYFRKNWSSVMLFNCEHPAHEALTKTVLNTAPGRDLHRFTWLRDDQIGALPAEWNYLVGHTRGVTTPKLVHFTDGIPSMPGYERCEFADDWWRELNAWGADPAGA
jgi:hypothetical protein